MGALDPRLVLFLSREVTSSKGSQYRTIVLDSIHTNTLPVPEFILAFNRPNYHTVKLHSLPLSVPYQITPSTNSSEAVTGEFFRRCQPFRSAPTHTHHLRPVRVRGLLQSRFPILSCPEKVQPAQPDRDTDRPPGYQWKRRDFVRQSACARDRTGQAWAPGMPGHVGWRRKSRGLRLETHNDSVVKCLYDLHRVPRDFRGSSEKSWPRLCCVGRLRPGP